ncbi:MAG: phenylalanine--tRNA ligase subunit alpha [Candidatus Altiarchaeota archaeon]|nr:phenylalanine--tRNA ligase subunit alpha [Candidatus Altiarchaeota archaeon]
MNLHNHELRILKVLKKKSTPEEIAEKASLPRDTVMRASSWLSTKDLIKVEERLYEEISLGEEGKIYAKKGLPERQVIELAGKDIGEIRGKVGHKEFGIAVGWLKKKNLALIEGGNIKVLGKGKTEDEKLLSVLSKGALTSDELTAELKKGLELLKKRQNVVRVAERKRIILIPTKKGMELGKGKMEESISQLTIKHLMSDKWKNTKFRPYDVNVFVTPSYPAKKHPLQRMIDRVKDIFVEMGFKEISGPLIESAFWNFDALFQPQDHPARDMHDTFYLERSEGVETEGFEKFKGAVKKTHEDGWTTGSRGWQYDWDENVARQTLLRTHTTAVTCRYLSNLKRENLPAKVFCIGKTFRNETIDYKHLPEFYQVEGIVVDEDVNFRHLLGVLNEFYQQMGFKVRFRPAYFPYTEPSVETEIYLKEKGEWIELGGAGIFRPEVVKPLLGFDCPVLAWGLGLDRLVALSLGLNDIRDLYVSDLDWLRRSTV